MKNPGKKILVCIDLTNESIGLVKSKTKDWDWTGISEVIFCHAYQAETYANSLYNAPYTPVNEHVDIKKEIEEVLEDIGDEIFENNSEKTPRYYSTCIISTNKKKSVTEYISKQNIDEVVIGTSPKQGLKGLFTSSFAQYMAGYSACDIRVLKHKFTLAD